METRDIELYRKCEDEVSAEHPFYCVCGRLATGLHKCDVKSSDRQLSADITKQLRARNDRNGKRTATLCAGNQRRRL